MESRRSRLGRAEPCQAFDVVLPLAYEEAKHQFDLSFEKISLADGRKIKRTEKRAVVETRSSESLRAMQPGDAGGPDEGGVSEGGENDRTQRPSEGNSGGSSSFMTGTESQLTPTDSNSGTGQSLSGPSKNSFPS